MPKISSGGVSDVTVDENFIAPPGVPPQDAIDRGLPDTGVQEKADDRSDGGGTEAGADGGGDVSGKPAKRAGSTRGRVTKR